MNGNKRWQDWLNLLLGVWLSLSPVLGVGASVTAPWRIQLAGGAIDFLSSTTVQAWNAYVAGGVVILLSLFALLRPVKWEEWFNFLIGLWIIIAPLGLEFTGDSTALWNHVLVGALICASALWAASQKPVEGAAITKLP